MIQLCQVTFPERDTWQGLEAEGKRLKRTTGLTACRPGHTHISKEGGTEVKAEKICDEEAERSLVHYP